MRTEKQKILAIIPARGGSKGIPRKNIADLCGKPLIAYSIETALHSKYINRIIVSTDDKEIADIAEQYGAEVPFLRPKSMARDNSSIGESIQYTLKHLNQSGYWADILIQLYPTHPFRTPELLDTMISKIQEGYKLARTVKKIAPDFTSMVRLDKGNSVFPFCQTQDTPKTFFRFHGTAFTINRTPVSAPFKTFLYHLNDPVTHIDIDTPADLHLARRVIENNLFDFKTT